MKQPTAILENGTRVLTHSELEPDGPFYMTKRRAGALGVITGVVGGYGGDVYYVTHGDGAMGAYSFSEFELEPPPEEKPRHVRRMSQGEMMVWAAAFAKEGGNVETAARLVCVLRDDDFYGFAHNEAFRKQMVDG